MIGCGDVGLRAAQMMRGRARVIGVVAFGVGPHRCIGSILAKRELMVSLQEWMKRIPEFELADPQPPNGMFGGTTLGFRSLVLEWPPTGSGARTTTAANAADSDRVGS